MSLQFHLYSSETKIDLLNDNVLSFPEYIIVVAAIYLHFIFYSIATIYILSDFEIELKKLYSSIEKIKLTWLRLIVIGFIILWGTAAVDFIVQVVGYRSFYLDGVSIVLLFSFANLIVYKGLKQPEIFTGLTKNKQKNKPFLPEATRIEYLNRLISVMKNEKPYLNPTLTLNQLAEKLSISPRYLSHVINNSFTKNFYDYVNYHRIEEAKLLLSNKENQDQTVLEILYESGFNSKSVFNASFKKHTGMTPLQYKKMKLL
ncbi:MAG: helix-turn-helix domain-containing protein [Calditrichia bacterium]